MRYKLNRAILSLIAWMFVFMCLGNLKSSADDLKDPRFLSISLSDLQQEVSQLPLTSSKHDLLIARAGASGLNKQVYEIYIQIWMKNPNNSYANLWLGDAAWDYWIYVTHQPKASPELSSALWNIMQSCLKKAVALDPSSSMANADYGFIQWQHNLKGREGVAMLKKALAKEPGNPYFHRLLGDIYTNPSGHYYEPDLA